MSRGLRSQARLMHCPICHKGFWDQTKFRVYCFDCAKLRYKKQVKEWHGKNKDNVRLRNKSYRVIDPKPHREANRRWKIKNKLFQRIMRGKSGFRRRYKPEKMGDLLFLINIMKKKSSQEFLKDKKVTDYLRRVCDEIETV